MTTPNEGRDSRQAGTFDEIRPLVEMCRHGQLFAVQEWIAAGKPVNPPPHPGRGARRQSPLDVAVERGFHSLVQVLLQAGAAIERRAFSGPMSRALQMRRFDLVRLLVEHGYDPASVDMREVFGTWDADLMEYFIERGAEVERGCPLAYALCHRIQTALRVFKRYQDRFPSFREQANIALRHHCKEGNMKWISLLLWAGADPYAPGPDSYDEEPDAEGYGVTALAYAALYRHFEVFKLKQVRLQPEHPAMRLVAQWSCRGEGITFLRQLLEMGMPANDQDNGGSSLIQTLLNDMSWAVRLGPWARHQGRDKIDTAEARDKLKAVHLVAKHGGRWVPRADGDVSAARRSLLKLTADYTVEFVWIMARYKSCEAASIQALTRTPTMKSHLGRHHARVVELVSSLAPDVAPP
jgi:hypothetical protein